MIDQSRIDAALLELHHALKGFVQDAYHGGPPVEPKEVRCPAGGFIADWLWKCTLPHYHEGKHSLEALDADKQPNANPVIAPLTLAEFLLRHRGHTLRTDGGPDLLCIDCREGWRMKSDAVPET